MDKAAQHQQRNILDSIQAEIGRDTSPLLEFLTHNASKIIAAIVLFILAILAYWGYSSYTASRIKEEQQAYSLMLANTNEANVLETLSNYIKTAPQSTRNMALATLATEAQRQQNHQIALGAWEEVAKNMPQISIEAGFGVSNAHLGLGNTEKAIETLESLLPQAANLHVMNIHSQIAIIAEQNKNFPRAIKAYEELVNFAGNGTVDQEKVEFWKTRILALQTQQ